MAEVSDALLSATQSDSNADLTITQTSTLSLELPAGSSAQSHLDELRASVCDGEVAGCTVTVSGSRRRKLQSTLTTFQIDIPVSSSNSLSTNATKSDALTNVLVSSVEQALGEAVVIVAPMTTSTSVTISLTTEGSVVGLYGR